MCSRKTYKYLPIIPDPEKGVSLEEIIKVAKREGVIDESG